MEQPDAPSPARIIQLIPAEDWTVAYWIDRDPYLRFVPLIAFALCEGNRVSGVDKEMYLCGEDSPFPSYRTLYGYFSSSELETLNVEKLRAQGKKEAESRRREREIIE